MRVVLIHVSGVPTHEVVEGRNEPALTGIICEIVPLEVVEKDVTGHIADAGDFSAFVSCFRWSEYFSGCMGDYFPPAGPILGADSNIVIALYPEPEESLSSDHLIVSSLKIIKLLGVLNIVLDVTAAASDDEVDQV
jgi:hypothetical protein